MKTSRITPLLIATLLASTPALLVAHSPSAANAATSFEADPTTPPLEGGAELVRAILSTGWGQLGEPHMTLLSKLSQGYNGAMEAERDGDREKAARIRAGVDHQLEHFLGELPLVLSVDLKGARPVMSGEHVFELPGDTGILLFRLDAGPARGGCAVMELDMENHRETEPWPKLPYIPGATRWVVVKALRAPAGTHHTYIDFQTPTPTAPVPGRFTTRVPEPGHLTVNILDGDSSDTTPLLVRFRHHGNGAGYKPSNAIDMAPQMHNIAGSMSVGAGNPDVLKVPNQFRGFYWCVPGSFSMTFPPGTWDIDLYKGIEYANLSDTITVTSGQTTTLDYRLKRWIDMRSRGWWSGDDHVHARLVSDDDADRLITWARASDVSVCNILRMGNHMRTVYEQRGYGPDFRVIRGNYALVPGQEDPRFFFGHSIGLNMREPVRDIAKYGLNDWVSDEVRRHGGLYGHAHMATNQFTISNDMAMMLPFGKSDFGELLQADVLGTATWYEFLDLGYPLAATAGSDMPYHSSIGEVRFYVYTGSGKLNVDDWFAGLKRGRTFVSNGPMLDLKIEDAIPGDTIRGDADRKLSVRLVAEGQPGQSSPKELRLIRFGETIAKATNADKQQGRLELTTTIPLEYGGWVAAYVKSHDKSEAHTTPVYLIREGFRPWDVRKADELITARLNSLGVMEATFDMIESEKASGAMWELNDFNNKLLAVMPRNRERLAEARAHYEQLRVELAEELKRRK